MGLRVETEIEFDHPLIGRQTFAVNVEPNLFRRELSRARTFGFMRDVTKLWSAGYALGAWFENTVVIAENRILNTEGTAFRTNSFATRRLTPSAIWRWRVHHYCRLRSVRGGHKLNHAVVTALMADQSAWTYSEMPKAGAPCRAAMPMSPGLRCRLTGRIFPDLACLIYLAFPP